MTAVCITRLPMAMFSKEEDDLFLNSARKYYWHYTSWMFVDFKYEQICTCLSQIGWQITRLVSRREPRTHFISRYNDFEFRKYQRQTWWSARWNTCQNLPHPGVASVEPLRLETTLFQKCMYMRDILCNIRGRVKGGFTHSMPCPCRSPAMPCVNPLDAELNPICHLLVLLGAHHILHISKIRVNSHTPCGAPALLRECRVLRESPCGRRKYPNC